MRTFTITLETSWYFTRTSPAGHGGTEGIGMGTVFCNVLTKPNNFLKIEILIFFEKKIFFKKSEKFSEKSQNPPKRSKTPKNDVLGKFQKIFFRSFFDFWVCVRQVRADFHLVEIICHMTCIYFSESSKGSANAYAIKKSYVTDFLI